MQPRSLPFLPSREQPRIEQGPLWRETPESNKVWVITRLTRFSQSPGGRVALRLLVTASPLGRATLSSFAWCWFCWLASSFGVPTGKGEGRFPGKILRWGCFLLRKRNLDLHPLLRVRPKPRLFQCFCLGRLTRCGSGSPALLRLVRPARVRSCCRHLVRCCSPGHRVRPLFLCPGHPERSSFRPHKPLPLDTEERGMDLPRSDHLCKPSPFHSGHWRRDLRCIPL